MASTRRIPTKVYVFFLVGFFVVRMVVNRTSLERINLSMGWQQFMAISDKKSKNNNRIVDGNLRKEPIWEWFRYNRFNASVASDDYKGGSYQGDEEIYNFRLFEQEARQRLLIAQYSAHGELLEVSSKLNRAYAEKWNHDYVLLQGITKGPGMWQIQKQNSTKGTAEPPNEYSRYNILTLLQMALSKRHLYDQLLLLDSTAMIYDFEKDVTALFHPSQDGPMVLVGPFVYHQQQQQQHRHFTGFWKTIWSRERIGHRNKAMLDSGVMLWNLNHPSIKVLVQEWTSKIERSLQYNGGSMQQQQSFQLYLYETLIQHDQSLSNLLSIKKEFEFPTGDLVKRFSIDAHGHDRDKDDWKRIDSVVADICSAVTSSYEQYQKEFSQPPSWKTVCDNLCMSKVPPRPPRWDWKYYSAAHTTATKTNETNVINTTNPSQRLLIAQYSAFGSYAKLLELTAPINKAYARLWKHDYVVLQGSAISVFPRDVWCHPPEERSRYNKIALLHMALARKDQYDMMLLLDADAMVYDFSKDVRSYLGARPMQKKRLRDSIRLRSRRQKDSKDYSKDIMLVAHRVEEANENPNQWNINNGVTLWNLHHPLTHDVAIDWYNIAQLELKKNPNTRSYMLTGDQSMLHAALRNHDRYKNSVYTYVHDFQYRNASTIKHFIRENLIWSEHDVWKMTSLDSRSQNIQNASSMICQTYFPACQGIEMTKYTKT